MKLKKTALIVGAIVVVAVLILSVYQVKTPVDDFEGDGGSSGYADGDDFDSSDDPVFAYAVVSAEGQVEVRDGVMTCAVEDMDVIVNPFISFSEGQIFESNALLGWLWEWPSFHSLNYIVVTITGPNAFVAEWKSDDFGTIGTSSFAAAPWEITSGRCFFNIHGTYQATLTVYGAHLDGGEIVSGYELLTVATKTFTV